MKLADPQCAVRVDLVQPGGVRLARVLAYACAPNGAGAVCSHCILCRSEPHWGRAAEPHPCAAHGQPHPPLQTPPPPRARSPSVVAYRLWQPTNPHRYLGGAGACTAGVVPEAPPSLFISIFAWAAAARARRAEPARAPGSPRPPGGCRRRPWRSSRHAGSPWSEDLSPLRLKTCRLVSVQPQSMRSVQS